MWIKIFLVNRFLPYFLLLICAGCGSSPADRPTGAALAAGPSRHSEGFNRSFGRLTGDYLRLAKGFVIGDDSLVLGSARALRASSDSLELDDLQRDSALLSTARNYAMMLSSEAEGLLGEPTPEGRRRSFQMLSDELYDLLRMVRYDGRILYYRYCASAFADQGAGWLSDTAQPANNPYLPGRSSRCGENRDTIGYQKNN